MMKKFVTSALQKEALDALKKLISIPSVLSDKEKNSPFGQPIREALDYILDLSKELGFRTYSDPEGYYGYAEIGQGDELVGILCHLDVVPVGDIKKWKTNPFKLTLVQEQLYGRGVQDDKGPTIAALYAVVSLMRSSVSFNKRIRLIFGTDEETLWRCMERYNQNEERATIGFAPDSSFPLVYAEKGLLQVKLCGPGVSQLLINVGDAFNVVPAKASYKGIFKDELATILDDLGYQYDITSETLTVLGVSKHSKDAAKGINAISRLVEGLSYFYKGEVLTFLKNEIGYDTTVQKLFGDLNDGVSGELSVNLAKLIIDQEHSEISLDIRIPVLADKDDLVKKLINVAKEYQLEYEEFDYLPSLYVPKDSCLVQTLLAAYRRYTGDLTEPSTTGGATFARTMDNCVAFGACFPWTKQTEHQENECMPLQDFYKVMEIYAEAIFCLLEIG